MNETVEAAAIRAWVIAGSQLDPSRVLWADQNVGRREAPYIVLNLIDVESDGLDWVYYTRTGPTTATATTTGTRSAALSIQCFAASALGVNSARKLLERVVSARSLPTVAAALEAARVGVGDIGRIQSAGGVNNFATFEPRAVMTVGLHLVATELTEATDFIETVEDEPDIDGP